MTRKKFQRSKQTAKKRNQIIAPIEPSPDLIDARRISTINQHIALLGICWVLYPLIDLSLGSKHLLKDNGVYVLLACGLINPVFMFAATRIGRYATGIFGDTRPAHEQIAKYRRLGKWQIALAITINVVGATPVLYAEGYLPAFAAQMPGAKLIGLKTSYALLFLIAAVGAALLAIIVDDVAKYFFRK
jgi:hypothetical protein